MKEKSIINNNDLIIYIPYVLYTKTKNKKRREKRESSGQIVGIRIEGEHFLDSTGIIINEYSFISRATSYYIKGRKKSARVDGKIIITTTAPLQSQFSDVKGNR